MTFTTDYDLGPEILEHMPALLRYARFLVRATDQAEDLVQDCITRALDRACLYTPNTDLRAWLFAILRNTFINQNRKANYRRNYARDYTAMGTGITSPNQFHSVALKESLRLVETLPVRERQAVLLLGVFDMSYIEAARHSGTKVGTMKSRTSRGRAHLRLMTQPENPVLDAMTAGVAPIMALQHQAAQ
ncbi:MAG: polymerase sigma-70 factor, subfamily [Aliidongia sp.]|jgi:RNA polymerase sigma-70 factor (ECF subfamily)|nr:polymerase sigma-70 factor, subfamily [Aliidongia sp.]